MQDIARKNQSLKNSGGASSRYYFLGFMPYATLTLLQEVKSSSYKKSTGSGLSVKRCNSNPQLLKKVHPAGALFFNNKHPKKR